jgi:CheY-like chemotaxis protein
MDTPEEPIRGKRILVVEDEPWVAALAVDLLAADGHQVDSAENGRVALGKVEEREYDLILCDVRMPELDGPGFYEEFTRRHPERARRVVFVTGTVSDPPIEEFLRRTGAPWLAKPFRIEELHRITQQVLRVP